MSYSKASCLKSWGTGYTETFGYAPKLRRIIPGLMDKHKGAGEMALEIGPGSGQFTVEWLAPRFKKVVALDYLSKLRIHAPNIEYHEVADGDCSCAGLADNTFDFAYSCGVFCHLSPEHVESYMRAIARVLKPRGWALLVFANYQRFAGAKHTGGWYYCDLTMATGWMRAAGFNPVEDVEPGCRDTVLLGAKA